MSVEITCPPPIISADPAIPPSALGVMTVDLRALVQNWRDLAALVGPQVQTSAVVKADAYGLGIGPVAQSLVAAGCRLLFVASPDEAVTLAGLLEASGVQSPMIGLLSGPPPGLAAELAQIKGLIPVLNDLGQLRDWQAAAPGRPGFLQLDTGMSRMGLSALELTRLQAEPERLQGVKLAGIMSHLACADDPAHPLNAQQLADFTRIARQFPGVPASLAASSGIFLGPAWHFDMVRPGAALYGVNPTPGQPNPLRQVVGVTARILAVRDIDAGVSVGYGATFRAERPRRVATIGLGYADGFLRSAGNQAQIRLGNHPLPVIGRVSMDLITLDVTALPADQLRPGQFVDVIGPCYDIDAFARDSGTIGYEVLTRLSHRLYRIYRPDHP